MGLLQSFTITRPSLCVTAIRNEVYLTVKFRDVPFSTVERDGCMKLVGTGAISSVLSRLASQ
jgi:hypothetical protein